MLWPGMLKYWEIPTEKELNFEDRLVLEKEEREIIKRIDELKKISYGESLKLPSPENPHSSAFCLQIDADIFCLEHDLDAIKLSLECGKRVY